MLIRSFDTYWTVLQTKQRTIFDRVEEFERDKASQNNRRACNQFRRNEICLVLDPWRIMEQDVLGSKCETEERTVDGFIAFGAIANSRVCMWQMGERVTVVSTFQV